MKPFVPDSHPPRIVDIDPAALSCAALAISFIIAAIGLFMGVMA
jgi:hypothetical protein